ncbi:MAG: tyrosine--tRNA ligase [Patescibacteria group bacterium]|nr:tyrosine--tRNA ligase [Patescibacteria group bacterium]
MKMITDLKKIEQLLTRAIEKIYPSKESLRRVLKSGRRLRVYFGIDPTAPTLHLDHGTSLFILKRFQELGHEVILLIGDFTARIGDPTGGISPRRQLSKKEVLENCKNYKKQASKILDFKSKKNPAKLKFNSQWLDELKVSELIKLAANFTHGQMIKRSMFQERLKKKKEIYLHEFLYPLFQGYDSVAMDVDVEVGGSDQIFNMLIGRELMKIYKKKEKYVIAKKLLEDPKTGKILMSKSEGRFIGLSDPPFQMYGKIMALSDEVIPLCFEHWTEIPMEKIKKVKENLKERKLNPRDVKARLAKEIVSIYHGKKAAERAEREFERVFKKKKLPTRIPEIQIKEKTLNILDLLVKTKLASSKSEAKRLILQKGVKIDRQIEEDWRKTVQIKKGMVIQVGKRKFMRAV